MTLTYCISLIEEAQSVLSNALTESELQTVSTAYENEPVIVFIDIFIYARHRRPSPLQGRGDRHRPSAPRSSTRHRS